MFTVLALVPSALLAQVPASCSTGVNDSSYSALDLPCYVGPVFPCGGIAEDSRAAAQIAIRDAVWYQVVLRNMALKSSEQYPRSAAAWTSATAVFVGGESVGAGWSVLAPGAITSNSACNRKGTGSPAIANSVASRGCSIIIGGCTSGGTFFGDPIVLHGPQDFDGEGHAYARANDLAGTQGAAASLPDDQSTEPAFVGAVMETHTVAGDFTEAVGYTFNGVEGAQCNNPGSRWQIIQAHQSAKRVYGAGFTEVSGSGLARISEAPEGQECGVVVRMFVDDSPQNSVVNQLSFISTGIDQTVPARSTYNYTNNSTEYTCTSTASGSGLPAVGSWRLTRLYRTVTNSSGVPVTQLWHRLSVTRTSTGDQVAWHYGTTFAPEAVPFDTVVETFLPTSCDSNSPVSFRITTTEGTLDAGSQSCLLLPAELDLDSSTSSASSIKVDFEDRLKFAEAYASSLGSSAFNPDADYVPDGSIGLADWQAFNVCYRANVSGCLADIAGANQAVHPDGVLTADDIIVFLSRYFANNLAADFSGLNQSAIVDGQLTADDIIVFLNSFFRPCP